VWYTIVVTAAVVVTAAKTAVVDCHAAALRRVAQKVVVEFTWAHNTGYTSIALKVGVQLKQPM
jgi:hypothetical protein